MLKKLFPYKLPYKKHAILSPFLMVLETFMDVLIPFLMAFIIDVGIVNKDLAYIAKIGGLMVAVALFALYCGSASAHHGATAGMGFAFQIRRAIFGQVQRFSFANLNQFNEASLITRLTTDSTTLGQTAMMSLRMAWRAPVMLILALVMSISINAELALVFAVALPAMVLLLFVVLKKAMPMWKELQKRLDRVNGRVQENLSAIRVVKSFVREEHEKKRFSEVNKAWMEKAMEAVSLMMTLGPLMSLIINGCIIAILWFGGHKILDGSMKAGQLLSFITYVMQIMMSLMMLSMYFLQLTRAKVCADRALEVIEMAVDIESPAHPVTELGEGSIEFEHVSFRYPGNGEDSLRDVTFKIEAGQTIGIIGSTGSAKSSLVQLIPRLYDATAGEVRVAGVNVKAFDLHVLREEVAFVLQKNTLFSGTVRSNMLWGNSQASDAEIRTALEQAQAADFVFANDEGLDYKVEQGGSNFSGGQQQRLCIARALLKKPKIIILDDSTSAVDMDTDARIRAVFKTKLKDVTTLVITQRIASIEHADRILVLDDGEVTGFDTHEVLLENNVIYQEVYDSQKRGVIGA